MPLPVGTYTVIVDAYRYFKHVKLVLINDPNVPKVAVFTLKKNNTIWGVPRLAFVTLTGRAHLFFMYFKFNLILFQDLY